MTEALAPAKAPPEVEGEVLEAKITSDAAALEDAEAEEAMVMEIPNPAPAVKQNLHPTVAAVEAVYESMPLGEP
jgi:hypothetical protein